jgi:predicted permease
VKEILSAILPVFLITAAAFAVRLRVPLHAKTLSSLNIYLLIPALVYSSISKSDIRWGVFGQIVLGSIIMLGAMTVLLGFAARRLKVDAKERSAFLMTMFPNLGNFGLPVCLFAFGEKGLTFAVVVMVVGSFLQNSVGIYYAQRTHMGVSDAFKRVFRFPMIYAFLLALAAQRFGFHPPVAVERAIDLTGDASIPIQLVMLGVQLVDTRLETGVNVFVASGIRLFCGPVIAAAIAFMIGLDGVAAKTFITQMSAPTAVGMAAYGVQFDVSPGFLSSVVSWTFLFAIFTVAAVLYVLSFFPC